MHQDEEKVVLTHENEASPDRNYEPLAKKSRGGFVRKVYGILCAQLLLTSLSVIAAATNAKLSLFLRANIALALVCCAICIVSLYALACYQSLARTVPHNYILLSIFTLSESYLV